MDSFALWTELRENLHLLLTRIKGCSYAQQRAAGDYPRVTRGQTLQSWTHPLINYDTASHVSGHTTQTFSRDPT